MVRQNLVRHELNGPSLIGGDVPPEFAHYVPSRDPSPPPRSRPFENDSKRRQDL
jgi:hypothetical protein